MGYSRIVTIFSILLVLSSCSTLGEFCGHNIHENGKECLKHLEQWDEEGKLHALLDELSEEEEQVIVNSLTKEVKRLEKLSSLIIHSKTSCEPVHKWAQNHTHIFLSIKLSHRWDSPPCSSTAESKYEVSDKVLIYINRCLSSNAEIEYKIEGKLFSDVKGLQVKKDGVGEYLLLAEKIDPEIWLEFFESSKVPVWAEVMNRNETFQQQFERARLDLELSKKYEEELKGEN